MRKILVIILFAAVAAFADHTLPNLSATVYSLNVGYSSLGRTEVSALKFRTDGGPLIGANLLRLYFRTSYDEGEYDSPPVSLGAPIVTIPAAGTIFLAFAHVIPEWAGILAGVAAFLASGELGYSLRSNNSSFFIFESHVFEWWLNKKNGKWRMDEVGWGQELGAGIGLSLIGLEGGVQFEITNKRKDVGWFARANLIDIIYFLK
ncbi:MAG: hypothetical protein MJZ05_06760 [Fibrobacter sp.]|nr:hypothetical protein [Fibrobacter sp.]